MCLGLCCGLLLMVSARAPGNNPVQVFGLGGGSELFSNANGSTVEGPEFSTTTRFTGVPATTTPNTNVFAVALYVPPGHTAVSPGPFGFFLVRLPSQQRTFAHDAACCHGIEPCTWGVMIRMLLIHSQCTRCFAWSVWLGIFNGDGDLGSRCPQGLGITSGVVINGVRQAPLVKTMFDQGVIPQPAFTAVFRVIPIITFSRPPTPGAHCGSATRCA